MKKNSKKTPESSRLVSLRMCRACWSSSTLSGKKRTFTRRVLPHLMLLSCKTSKTSYKIQWAQSCLLTWSETKSRKKKAKRREEARSSTRYKVSLTNCPSKSKSLKLLVKRTRLRRWKAELSLSWTRSPVRKSCLVVKILHRSNWRRRVSKVTTLIRRLRMIRKPLHNES